MVEVIVAFTLLAILMLLFSQGIANTTKAESKATNDRKSADNAMKSLQKELAKGENTGTENYGSKITVGDPDTVDIVPYTYSENGYKYVVYRIKE